MAGLYNWILNKIRGIRYSVANGFSQRTYAFGAIYSGPYKNYKHDPNPLVFIMYSDKFYTHSLNIHYMSENDRQWFIKAIYMMKKYGQSMNGRYFYNYLKMQRYSIVKACYRMYHTNLCNYKLVSAGITPLEKMVYQSNEPFVRRLNEAINPEMLAKPPTQVAYSQEELQERIIEGMNAIPIQKRTIRGNVPAAVNPFGIAPWARR